MAQCQALVGSININEGVSAEPYFNDILKSETAVCIMPDGSSKTVKEAIRWLDEKEKEKDKAAKAEAKKEKKGDK